MVAIDVQTMLRWVENGGMVYHDWKEKKELLPYIRFLKTDAGKGFAFVGPSFTDAKYFGDGIGIAVRKGDKANVDRINAAIDAIRANGKYKEIEKKYFNFDIYGPDSN